MTAPALVKSADLKRMADIALEKGVRVEIEVDGKIIRVAPDIPTIHSSDRVETSLPTGSNALSEWRKLNEGRFSGRSLRQEKAR
jgi:hypothetical protein